MGSAEGSAAHLLDPHSTAAVVLGAHDWTEAGMGRAPSFLRSARSVVRYLYDPAGLGLDPELVLDLFDDTAGAGDQLARVRDTLDVQFRERRDASRPVTDVLVYYIGHGYTDDEGHLSLLVRRSRRGLEAETGIKAPDLARTLRLAAPQQRRAVILDCCFSEAAARAFIGMSSDLNQQVAATAAKDLGGDQPTRGTLLLCSSPVGQISMGAPNAERTLFTGAILDSLREGLDAASPFMSFAQLRDAAFDRMVGSFGANAPRPVLHQVNAAHGDLTRAPAFPNPKAIDPAPTSRHAAASPAFADSSLEAGRLAAADPGGAPSAPSIRDEASAAIVPHPDGVVRLARASVRPAVVGLLSAIASVATSISAVSKLDPAGWLHIAPIAPALCFATALCVLQLDARARPGAAIVLYLSIYASWYAAMYGSIKIVNDNDSFLLVGLCGGFIGASGTAAAMMAVAPALRSAKRLAITVGVGTLAGAAVVLGKPAFGLPNDLQAAPMFIVWQTLVPVCLCVRADVLHRAIPRDDATGSPQRRAD